MGMIVKYDIHFANTVFNLYHEFPTPKPRKTVQNKRIILNSNINYQALQPRFCIFMAPYVFEKLPHSHRNIEYVGSLVKLSA